MRAGPCPTAGRSLESRASALHSEAAHGAADPFTGRADSIAHCRVVSVSTVRRSGCCRSSYRRRPSALCARKDTSNRDATELARSRIETAVWVSRYPGAFNLAAGDRTSHCRGDDTVASPRVRLHTCGLLPVAGCKRAVSPRTWVSSRSGMEVAPATIRATAQQLAARVAAPAGRGRARPRRGRAFPRVGAPGRQGRGGDRQRAGAAGDGARRVLLRPGAGDRSGHAVRFRLDGGPPYPDPASRFQPEGPHGPSEVVDPTPSPGPTPSGGASRATGQVIYEMHVGTFTPEGTWARRRRASCRSWPRAGITVARGDAGRGVPRRLRLGLRRRRPVRADPALRPAGRLPALRRSRARARASA